MTGNGQGPCFSMLFSRTSRDWHGNGNGHTQHAPFPLVVEQGFVLFANDRAESVHSAHIVDAVHGVAPSSVSPVWSAASRVDRAVWTLRSPASIVVPFVDGSAANKNSFGGSVRPRVRPRCWYPTGHAHARAVRAILADAVHEQAVDSSMPPAGMGATSAWSSRDRVQSCP